MHLTLQHVSVGFCQREIGEMIVTEEQKTKESASSCSTESHFAWDGDGSGGRVRQCGGVFGGRVGADEGGDVSAVESDEGRGAADDGVSGKLDCEKDY